MYSALAGACRNSIGEYWKKNKNQPKRKEVSRIKTEPVNKNNIDIQSIDCVLQHAKFLRSQAIKKQLADFSEPCANCIHAKECVGFDWLEKWEPLLEMSNVEITVCLSKEEKVARDRAMRI